MDSLLNLRNLAYEALSCLALTVYRAPQCLCHGPAVESTWEVEANRTTGETEME